MTSHNNHPPSFYAGKPLSVRELEVLNLLVAGCTNQQIAYRLAITVKTVEQHINKIFSKFQVSSRVEAAVYSIRAGIMQ